MSALLSMLYSNSFLAHKQLSIPLTTHPYLIIKSAPYIYLRCLLEEYIPFILLLLALYTVSGGILVWGPLRGTPKNNVILLAIGTCLASLMGTTGAAMLTVRPLIRANAAAYGDCR